MIFEYDLYNDHEERGVLSLCLIRRGPATPVVGYIVRGSCPGQDKTFCGSLAAHGAPKKSVVAVAHRLARIPYQIHKKEEEFDVTKLNIAAVSETRTRKVYYRIKKQATSSACITRQKGPMGTHVIRFWDGVSTEKGGKIAQIR